MEENTQSTSLDSATIIEAQPLPAESTALARVETRVEPEKKSFWSWLNAPPLNTIVVVLSLYLGISLVLWGIVVLDVVSQQFHILSRLSGGPIEPSVPLTLITLTLCGGAIGGNIYSFDKLIKYATKSPKPKKNTKGAQDVESGDDDEADGKDESVFNIRHSMDYLMRQFIAAALGAVFFVLVMGGFINVDQLKGASDASAAFDTGSGYFAFALGFLVGFGSYQVTRKLDQIIKVMFGRLAEEDLKSTA